MIFTDAVSHVIYYMERKHGVDGIVSFFGSAGKWATYLVLFAIGKGLNHV